MKSNICHELYLNIFRFYLITVLITKIQKITSLTKSNCLPVRNQDKSYYLCVDVIASVISVGLSLANFYLRQEGYPALQKLAIKLTYLINLFCGHAWRIS